jgi:hypothetical protein
LFGRLFHVQQVVDDLKGKPERQRILAQRVQLFPIGTGEASTTADRGDKQRTGLLAMQILKLVQFQLLTLSEQVDYPEPAASASSAIVSINAAWGAANVGADADCASTLNASVSSPSPASVASASPNTL